MTNLIKYQTALDKVSEVAPLLMEDSQVVYKRKAEEFIEEVHESKYIKVPLVGIFSAGKVLYLTYLRKSLGCFL